MFMEKSAGSSGERKRGKKKKKKEGTRIRGHKKKKICKGQDPRDITWSGRRLREKGSNCREEKTKKKKKECRIEWEKKHVCWEKGGGV